MRGFVDVPRILRETFVAQSETFPSLNSTNDWAKRRAAEPSCVLPLLVVAEAQTAAGAAAASAGGRRPAA